MAIPASKIDTHWNYFLSVEQDLMRLSRYIEFHEDNYDCYSLEIVRLLMASAAEVDVVCKQICQTINPNSTASSIHKYRDEIFAVYPVMAQFEVVAPRFGLSLNPWSNWNQLRGVPLWWNAYNKAKHHRHTHYAKANLKNVLNAVAGLFVACLYLYKDKAETAELIPSPMILQAGDEWFGGAHYGSNVIGTRYNLEEPKISGI